MLIALYRRAVQVYCADNRVYKLVINSTNPNKYEKKTLLSVPIPLVYDDFVLGSVFVSAQNFSTLTTSYLYPLHHI